MHGKMRMQDNDDHVATSSNNQVATAASTATAEAAAAVYRIVRTESGYIKEKLALIQVLEQALRFADGPMQLNIDTVPLSYVLGAVMQHLKLTTDWAKRPSKRGSVVSIDPDASYLRQSATASGPDGGVHTGADMVG